MCRLGTARIHGSALQAIGTLGCPRGPPDGGLLTAAVGARRGLAVNCVTGEAICSARSSTTRCPTPGKRFRLACGMPSASALAVLGLDRVVLAAG